MDAALTRLIWQRAKRRCEYCQLPQEADDRQFEIDHVRSRKHRGPTLGSNLALSCFRYNSFKGSDISSIGDHTRKLMPLLCPSGEAHLQSRARVCDPVRGTGLIPVRRPGVRGGRETGTQLGRETGTQLVSTAQLRRETGDAKRGRSSYRRHSWTRNGWTRNGDAARIDGTAREQKVESRCGAVASSERRGSVSTPRSSNWTGSFPASSFRTRRFSSLSSHVRTQAVAASSVGVDIVATPGTGRRRGSVSYPDPAP
jgi:HNH endonuclease